MNRKALPEKLKVLKLNETEGNIAKAKRDRR